MVFHTKQTKQKQKQNQKKLQKLKFKTHLTGFGGTMLKRMGACVAVYPIETVSSICVNWENQRSRLGKNFYLYELHIGENVIKVKENHMTRKDHGKIQ